MCVVVMSSQALETFIYASADNIETKLTVFSR